MNIKQEYITCAAIHVQDGKKYQSQPKNIESGLVICGHRHGDCYVTYFETKNYNRNDIVIQGFMTSNHRFVNRKEAWKIAKANNQVENATEGGITISDVSETILISEDLY